MPSRPSVPFPAFALALALTALPATLLAQGTGTVSGQVTQAGDGAALAGVSVIVSGTGLATVTGNDGRYTLRRVPAGARVVVFRWLGYRPTNVDVNVTEGGTTTANASLEPVPVQVGDIIVSGASRAPERVVEALGTKPILTVSDMGTAAGSGVMIRFVQENNRLRIRINLDAVTQSGLTVSSKLLRASEVFTSGRPQ